MADTRVNYYGSSLDSNKDDEEEDLYIIIVEVRYFELPLQAVPNLFSTKAPKLLLSSSGKRKCKSDLCLFGAMCAEERKRSVYLQNSRPQLC